MESQVNSKEHIHRGIAALSCFFDLGTGNEEVVYVVPADSDIQCEDFCRISEQLP